MRRNRCHTVISVTCAGPAVGPDLWMIDEGVETPTAIIVPRAAGVAPAFPAGVAPAVGACASEPGCAAVLLFGVGVAAAGDGTAGGWASTAPLLGAAALP